MNYTPDTPASFLAVVHLFSHYLSSQLVYLVSEAPNSLCIDLSPSDDDEPTWDFHNDGNEQGAPKRECGINGGE